MQIRHPLKLDAADAAIEKKHTEDGASLMTLPTEIHLLVSQSLTYPDALSLKHTNRHFYNLVYIGLNLKIEWLIERRRLHLDCPNDKKCELGSDLRFCRGSVRLLMERRRQHGECDTREGGRGCLVFGTKICTFQKKQVRRFTAMRSWVESNPGTLLMIIALLGVTSAWAWTSMRKAELDAGT